MGCWNKTCGLSNLYINDNEPVYAFVLLQNNTPDKCYNTAFYTPILVPFECVYDDYGGGVDAHGAALEPLLNAIKGNSGENGNLAIDEFFDLVLDNNINYINSYGTRNAIDLVMMRKDVVDHILQNWHQRVWAGPDMDEDGYYTYTYRSVVNGWFTYTYQDVINDIPEFIAGVTECSKQWLDEKDPAHGILFAIASLKSYNFQSIFDPSPKTGVRNLVSIELGHAIYTRMFSPNDHIAELIVQGKFEDAVDFITDSIKGAFVNSMIDSVRKQWLPGCHEGSQACNHDGYRMLMNATTMVLDKKESGKDEE